MLRWRDGGRAEERVNNALSVLSAPLGRAGQDGCLPSNPCAPVRKIGRPAPPRPRALTPREIEAIRAELSGQADKVVWGLMAYAALRPSEALAVRWGDLEGSLLVVDAMKTLRRRVVDVIGPLQDDLDAFRPRDAARGDLVATSPQGLPISLGNWRWRVFLPACGRAGIDADPKDGRTSCISLMVHEDRSLAYVAASMGNSARVISGSYLHVLRAAELGARMPMAEAVYQARGAGDVRQMFGAGVVLPFRRASQRDKSA
jgi:integrase